MKLPGHAVESMLIQRSLSTEILIQHCFNFAWPLGYFDDEYKIVETSRLGFSKLLHQLLHSIVTNTWHCWGFFIRFTCHHLMASLLCFLHMPIFFLIFSPKAVNQCFVHILSPVTTLLDSAEEEMKVCGRTG